MQGPSWRCIMDGSSLAYVMQVKDMYSTIFKR